MVLRPLSPGDKVKPQLTGTPLSPEDYSPFETPEPVCIPCFSLKPAFIDWI